MLEKRNDIEQLDKIDRRRIGRVFRMWIVRTLEHLHLIDE